MYLLKMSKTRRRKMVYFKFIVPRRIGTTIRIVFVATTLAALVAGWHLSALTGRALLFPYPPQELDHLRLNRNLKVYLENITLLIQPSTASCNGDHQPVVAVVTSTALHFDQRMVIRESWGKYIPTFFLLGLPGPSIKDLLIDNYVEAKEFGDLIIYDFQDHYQNLTIKTALMMKWAGEWCPNATYVFKTDDDVLVNPWVMKQLVSGMGDEDLIGYRKENTYFHRDEYNKWYMPRWLRREDHIPEYLSGTGYLINGRHLRSIVHAAYDVPMINLEDVYFTYLVSKLKLNLTLEHDHRLSPYKPWFPNECFYWGLASAHSLTPAEMERNWFALEKIGGKFENGTEVCKIYEQYFTSELFLY